LQTAENAAPESLPFRRFFVPGPAYPVFLRKRMSPTGKGTDSPCIPRCATGGPVSYRLRAYGAARYARSSAVHRAAGVSM